MKAIKFFVCSFVAFVVLVTVLFARMVTGAAPMSATTLAEEVDEYDLEAYLERHSCTDYKVVTYQSPAITWRLGERRFVVDPVTFGITIYHDDMFLFFPVEEEEFTTHRVAQQIAADKRDGRADKRGRVRLVDSGYVVDDELIRDIWKLVCGCEKGLSPTQALKA